MGRPSVYGPKESKKIQTISLTAKGAKLFEQARERLRKLAKWQGKVSDSDTIEFLVRDKELDK